MKDRLKECRIKSGLTQKYVAYTLGVSMPSVSQWESGVNTPTIENLIQLADLYGASLDYLAGRDGTAPAPRAEQYTAAEKKIIDNYRSLNKQGQEYIRQQLAIAQQIYTGESAHASNVEAEA